MNKSYPLFKVALASLALSFLLAPLHASAEEAAPEKKLSKAKEKYDTDKDGKLSAEEKAAAKEAATAKAKATREANLAKYDLNKDGKLDETEKAALKADEDAAKAAKKAEREAKKAAKEEGSK